MTRPRIGWIAAILALATVAHAEGDDDDDKPETQRMRFVERGDDLTVTMQPPAGIGKLFDSAAYEAMSSGYASTVVIQMQVHPRDSTKPIAEQLIQRSVVYDLWDEVYTLRLDEPGGRRTVKVKYRAEALKYLTAMDDIPIAHLANVPIEQIYVLDMVVQLNPVSKETLAEVRRWLTQGNGAGIDRGGTFFGSFVSVFYNTKIAEADRVLRIRSQPFLRPKP